MRGLRAAFLNLLLIASSCKKLKVEKEEYFYAPEILMGCVLWNATGGQSS